MIPNSRVYQYKDNLYSVVELGYTNTMSGTLKIQMAKTIYAVLEFQNGIWETLFSQVSRSVCRK